MSEEAFDAIVVGGGVSGCVAAYVMAKEGLNVLLVERGAECGEKEMTGGRIYTHSLKQYMPECFQDAPLERRVEKERISFTYDNSAFTVDYTEDRDADPKRDSYSVLSSRLVRWLGERAEEAGAMVACGIRVDDLLIHDGRVSGIIAGDDVLEAKVVVLADGVNSLLAEKAGIERDVSAHRMAVGVKELIELDEEQICDRFGVEQGKGVAWLFAGGVTEGAYGGSFLYTNKTSVSLGLIRTLSDIEKGELSLPAQLDAFKKHPVVAPLLKDGKTIEYSGHMVPEPDLDFVPGGKQLHVPGCIVVGDAAGLIINIGFMVRGLDLAVASGGIAARAIAEAHANKKLDSAGSLYEQYLKDSFILQDMDVYKRFPIIMTNHRIFNEYPQMLTGLMSDMFVLNPDEHSKPVMGRAMARIKEAGGIRSFLRDFRGFAKALR
ncbi:MAG: FAD-dependent oxidoreductase [Coriobacteriia bacterium]|nr:FAD-dependent oxidoreductase [Coriobacteriia bacterium]